MKQIRLLANFVLVLLFTSCVAERKFVSPDYKGKKIKNASLAIIKLQNPINVSNMDDFKDDFKSENASDTLLNLLYNEAVPSIKKVSYFQSAEIIDYSKKPEFESKLFGISKMDSMSIQVPKNMMIAEYVDTKADIILLIDGITTFAFWESVSGPYGGKTKILRYSANYLIYDKNANKIVSFGTANGDNSVTFGVTRSTWVENVKYLMAAIFNGTSYGKF